MGRELLLTTDLPIGKKYSGKVRDNYDLGDGTILIIATDRVSAFDVVLPDGIPFKGHVLNKLSVLWLTKLANIIPNHFITDNVTEYPPACHPYAQLLENRSMLVKKAKPLPVECVVRGYLAGSAWESYEKDSAVCGIKLPPGLLESQELPMGPIFTPATKAEAGFHDENISLDQAKRILSPAMAERIREKSLALYIIAKNLAKQADLIIADTKFEFGLDEKGNVILIDEALTPDSSRIWPADKYVAGQMQESYDKQPIRDYLESIGWNKKSPAPNLPAELIEKTSQRYLEAYVRLLWVLKQK